MKILLLTPDSPFPSASGAAIRNFGIIRGLHQHGHQVTLLSYADDIRGPATSPLNDFCHAVALLPIPRHSKTKRVWKLVTSAQADMEHRLYSEAYQQQLKRVLNDSSFDIIQFSGLELGCMLPQILAQKRGAVVIYDALNAEAELQRLVAAVDRRRPGRLPVALYSSLQARRLRRFEREICRSVDAVLAVSEEDRAHLKRHNGAPLYLMPNGISADDYAPPSGKARGHAQLVFTGKMDYRPNVDAIEWFAGDVFPHIQSAHPATTLAIVGRNPHQRILDLAATPSIGVTGWVESVLPYLHSATVYIAPLRMGSGTRLKILEAMAAGCVIVSTNIGASGLHPDLRAAMLLADDAEAFAQAVTSLLDDPDLRNKLGTKARAAVRGRYDWSALMPRLLQAYEDLGLG